MKRAVTYLIIGIVLLLLTTVWGFYVSIKPPKIISDLKPSDFQMEYETLVFKTEDNLNLTGWFIPHENNPEAKTIILLHGYPADKGNILPIANFLHFNYNLFLFDFRYLGESEGKYSTAGGKETKDLKAAIQYLKTRGINEVGLWGFSMGGAVALMTASEAPEIKAVISESSYAHLRWMAYELYQVPVLRYPLGWLTGAWAKTLSGLSIGKVSPAESAKELKIPVLIIHSAQDQVISFKNALEIQKSLKNNPKAEFWFQEGLVHGQWSEDYQKRVLDFFERNL